MGLVWLLLLVVTAGLLNWMLVASSWLWYAGIALCLPSLYAVWAVIDPRRMPHRPLAGIVSSCFWLSIAFGLFLAIGSLIRVDFAASPMTEWSIGSGVLEHSAYGFRRTPVTWPRTSLQFSPGVTVIASAYAAIGRTGSWTSRIYALWIPFAAFAVPTCVLARLRRERVPPGRCRKCEYDLTDNTSGICPECGTPIDVIVTP